MILRKNPVSPPDDNARQIRRVWQTFLDTQKTNEPPYGIVLQPDHANLAGDIAAVLDPAVFGSIPAEVIHAISTHDAGWRNSDEAQLQAIGEFPPRPFPMLQPEETMSAWYESVRLAELVSPLTGVIVARHFCALAGNDQRYEIFLWNERPRLERAEANLGIRREHLDRWMAAIGFCDVLSLYLCCGTNEPAEFALGHPALPESQNARRIFVGWKDGRPRLSEPVIASGATVSVPVFDWADAASGHVSWKFE